MIVVDSSVFIAILEQESDAEHFLSVLRGATRRLASAITVYETGIVIGARRGGQSADEIMAFLLELGVEIVPFAEPYISQALDAYSRFGKGINPKARLNLGDSAAYALAKVLHVPLLFKATDFSQTDI
ncbi:MAG TPA: type II toxin-antitoxin system VapC family toxin [Bradyrhizobium sp.]|jgi:ribonuclease VapC|nr:type II toxin-antitoxin system VapC family toxin [Bradyrhizobium sp.]